MGARAVMPSPGYRGGGRRSDCGVALARSVELPRGLNVVYALDNLNDPISNPFVLPLPKSFFLKVETLNI
jgi:hypothetical protein